MLIAAAAFLLGSASAPVAIYGVTIAAPLQMTECALAVDVQRWRKGPQIGSPYRAQTIAPCYARRTAALISGKPLGAESVSIRFPRASTPALVAGEMGVKLDAAGLVRSASFATRGYQFQEAVLEELTHIFGQPGLVKRSPLQNGSGAQYSSIKAAWAPAEDVTVVFEGVGRRLDYGFVTITATS